MWYKNYYMHNNHYMNRTHRSIHATTRKETRPLKFVVRVESVGPDRGHIDEGTACPRRWRRWL